MSDPAHTNYTLEGYDRLQAQLLGQVMQKREFKAEDIEQLSQQRGRAITEDEQDGMRLMMGLDGAARAHEELGSYFQALPEQDKKTLRERLENLKIKKVDYFPDLYDTPAVKPTP